MPGVDGPAPVASPKALDPHVLQGLDRFLARPYPPEVPLQALHLVISQRRAVGDPRLTQMIGGSVSRS